MASTTTTAVPTPLADSIRQKIEAAMDPVRLTITNNSHKHRGHVAMRGVESGETHFELEVITPAFQGKSQVVRHRQMYDLLAAEMAPGLVHALQLHTRTPEEDERYQARERAKQDATKAARDAAAAP